MRKQIAFLVGVSLLAPYAPGAPAAPAVEFRPTRPTRPEEKTRIEEKREYRERLRSLRSDEVRVALDKLAVGSSKLARMLVTRLRATGMKNVTISPLSLQVALGMALQAARGDTAKELMLALGVDNMTPEEISLASRAKIDEMIKLNQEQIELATRNRTPEKATIFAMFNAFYGNPDLVKEFKEDLQRQLIRDFGAEVIIAPFTDDTVKHINGKVAETTRDNIKALLEKLEETHTAVLLNAVYLKASWQQQFPLAKTNERGEFHRGPGQSSKEMPLMNHYVTVPHVVSEDGKAQAIALPMWDRHFVADVVLPEMGESLDTLLDLNPSRLALALDNAPEVLVDLTLPRFETRLSPVNLVETFKSAGIVLPFEIVKSRLPGGTPVLTYPDFGKLAEMLEPGKTYFAIDQIVHAARMKVTEVGIEASAATAVVIGLRGTRVLEPVPEIKMTVDHPFVMTVRGLDNSTYFITFVDDPEALARPESPATPEF
ncbi:MAG: hypothetical protein C5B49_10805 [Bdellovibrio sp.]|nr:MAG: hypothetical protein C5B49_10805 [Bdellovibrio sp.]